MFSWREFGGTLGGKAVKHKSQKENRKTEFRKTTAEGKKADADEEPKEVTAERKADAEEERKEGHR